MSAERDYRDDYPLSDAIRDAYNDGMSDGASWSTTVLHTDERDYAMKRADALEAEVERLRRVVPLGAEPPELVGFTTTDDVEACCESCGDPCDGECRRHDHACCPPDDCCGGPCDAHPCWDLTT